MQPFAAPAWFVALALGLASTTLAVAQDTAHELAVGGLVFAKSADLSLESEELTITPETITVRYRILNQSAKPVTLSVSFPLPEIDLAEGDNFAIPASDQANFLGFEVKVDGKPVALALNQRAMSGDKDVSAQLRALRLPIFALGTEQDKLADLAPAARDKLAGDGLLVAIGQSEAGKPIYGPGWKVKTSATRQQTFSANKVAVIEVGYKTSLGMSFDTVTRRALRQNAATQKEAERYRQDYCLTDKFLAEVDKIAGTGAGNTAKVQERRINYVLKTGPNALARSSNFGWWWIAERPTGSWASAAPTLKC